MSTIDDTKDAFLELDASVYEASSTSEVRQKAIRLYQSGGVQKIMWSSGNIMYAGVQDGGNSFSPTLKVKQGVFQSSCKCREIAPCSHALAVLISFLELVKGESIADAQPSLSNVQELMAGFNISSEARSKKALLAHRPKHEFGESHEELEKVESYLVFTHDPKHERNNVVAHLKEKEDIKFFDPIIPENEMYRIHGGKESLRHGEVSFYQGQQIEFFNRLNNYLPNLPKEFGVYCAHGNRYLKFQHNGGDLLTPRLSYHCSDGKLCVEFVIVDGNDQPCAFMCLQPGVFVTDMGQIVCYDVVFSNFLRILIGLGQKKRKDKGEFLWEYDFVTEIEEVFSLDLINRGLLASGVEVYKMIQHLLCNNKKLEIRNEIEVQIHLDYDVSQYQLRIVPVRDRNFEILMSEVDRQIEKAVRYAYILDSWSSESIDRFHEIVAKNLEEDDFNDKHGADEVGIQAGSSAEQSFKDCMEEIQLMRDIDVCPQFVDSAEGLYLLKIPTDKIFSWALFFAIRFSTKFVGNTFILPNKMVEKRIGELAKLCESFGIPIYYKSKRLLVSDVQMKVNVQETDIDWFELKPEVLVADFKLPEKYWLNIREKRQFIEAGDHFILLGDEEQERLEEFRLAVTSVKEGSFGRLKILDLLELRKSGAEVNIPSEIEDIYESLSSFERIPTQRLPGSLAKTLRNYQRVGVNWLSFLYKHRFGACLADDMGLGKTLQAISFLAAFYDGKIKVLDKKDKDLPSIIIMPPSLIFNWASELEKFYPELTVADYVGQNRDIKVFQQKQVILTTYDIVRRDVELLEEIPFNIAILDEVQALKNIQSRRSIATMKLKRNFTICLTGTPMENHAGEYYSIMNLAIPGIFNDYKYFQQQLKWGNVGLLNRARPFLLRRTKEKILKDLPPKVESDIYLDMTDTQKEIYVRTVDEVRDRIEKAYSSNTSAQAGIVALSALTMLRQVCISPAMLDPKSSEVSPKIEFLLSKLQELNDEGHAALVFSQFTKALDLIELQMEKEGIPYLRLDGSTPTAKRAELVEQFQEKKSVPFFLISLKAGGVGLNLTRANYVFHVDPWWNPAVENQASDRVHRMGQDQKVFIQRILMRNSIEEKIMKLKSQKAELFNDIIGNASTTGKSKLSLNAQDFSDLLA
jgi:hypothetical protein